MVALQRSSLAVVVVVVSLWLACEADPLRYRRSTGCGENPLLKMLKVGMAEGNALPSEVLKVLDENSHLRSYILKSIQKFEDCVKAADGMKFKRNRKQEITSVLESFVQRDFS